VSTLRRITMISRREFMAGSVALAVASSAPGRPAPEPESILVNDIHSQLNSTRVLGILQPRSLEDVQSIVRSARKDRKIISVAGGRHAMGGQQFGSDTLLVDIRKLSQVLNLDGKRGMIEVEAGIEWPELIDRYLTLQNGDRQSWGIAQKQTGADRLTMAGTIAANAHGRGLKMKPFISDVESLVLVDATGTAHTCSRKENPELFRLVPGGYGLFGIVTSVQLRLVPRKKIERAVETVRAHIAAADHRHHIAASGQEAVRRVLGVDARFNRVSVQGNISLAYGQLLARGDAFNELCCPHRFVVLMITDERLLDCEMLQQHPRMSRVLSRDKIDIL